MFYAKITAPDAQPLEMLIDTAADYDIYYAASFNPLCTVTRFNFDLRGSTYAERRTAAREMAQEWQSIAAETALSYGELAEIAAFFATVARRCGLLREFRENGIV